MLNPVRSWLRGALLRGRLEREMQEEMAEHLARSEARLRARGLTAEEARWEARREFGNVASLQEQARDARGGGWVESIASDLRFGLRHFARTPVSTATMVVLLALGIGFNVAVFTVMYSFASMPPPGVARQESLVRIRGIDRSGGPVRAVGREFSYAEYREYAAQRGLFGAVAAWTSADVVLGAGGGADGLHSAAATFVTAGYFPVLGVRPVLGAGLPTSLADGGTPEPVAVISHAVWERAFGRATDVIGRSVTVNEVPVTIVGVAPPRFGGARAGGSQMRVWLPLNTRSLVLPGAASLASHDSTLLGLVARLAPGVEPGEASPAAAAIGGRRAPTSSADVVTLRADNYFPPSGERPSMVGRVSSLFIPLLILLICCTNVSGLLVGLAAARRREIAVRLSLGATRRRVLRQLVTESVLLAMAGALVGLLVIALLLRAFGERAPDVQLVLHWPSVAVAFVLSIATGILFGVSPALHATRLSVADVLKDAGAAVSGARTRLHAALVVAQVALTQPLLFGVGTLVLELREELMVVPSSPVADRIMQVSFNTNPRYGAIDASREEALRRVQARIAALPGVEGVVPQGYLDGYERVEVHPADRVAGGGSPDSLWLRTRSAPPGYLTLMGYSFVRGRDFAATGAEEGQALVIRGDLARRLWGTANPVGRRFVHAGDGAGSETAFVVVGVLDETSAGRSGPDEQHVFVPGLGTTGSLLVRTRGPAQPMIPLVRSVALTEAPSHPVTGVTTLAAIEAGRRSSGERARAAASLTGLAALLITAVGLYAVVAFAVGQRTREIGIRTALGADRRRVVGIFVRRGLGLGLLGLLIGLTLSIAVNRAMARADEVEPASDAPLVAAAIAAVMLGMTLLATWIPARRAARVDPITALRAD